MFCFLKLGKPLLNTRLLPSLPAAVSTCKMAMYNQTYFRGKLVEISESVNDFETINFDNSIASVKFEGNCCWTLFADKDFQGASVKLKIGDYRSATNIVDVFKKVEGHFNPGLFNPKLQPQTFQLRTFQP